MKRKLCLARGSCLALVPAFAVAALLAAPLLAQQQEAAETQDALDAASAEEAYHESATTPAPPAALPDDALLRVDPAELRLEVGQSAQLTATLRDQNGQEIEGQTVVFYSRDRRQVEVNPTGRVRAHGPGEFTIVALVPSDSEEGPWRSEARLRVEIPVTVPSPPVASVSVIDLPPVLYARTSLRLVSRVLDVTGAERQDLAVTYQSSTPAVALPDAFGYLELLAPGTTTLTARAGETQGSVALEVSENPMVELSLTADQTEVRTGDVVQFRAVGLDARGRPVPDLPVQFAVAGQTDPLILAPGAAALVEPDGAFVAERSGVYTVTAVCGPLSASRRVGVRPRNVRKEAKFVGQGPVRDRHSSDLWIWEGPDGRDYAITGTWGAEGHAYIWDVTHPESIALIDTVKVDARTVNDVKISADGRLAVMTREGASNRKNGLVILDVSEPQVGVRILSRFDDQLRGGVHNVFLYDHHIYALSNARRYDIINIEDPAQPYRVGRFELDTPGHSIHDVWVQGGIAYSANWEDGVVAVDVGGGGKGGAPNHPVMLGSYAYPNGWNHSAFPYRSQSTGKFYIFAADEAFPYGLSGRRPDEAPPRAEGWIHVIEWPAWDKPREVARYRVPEAGSHDLWVEDDVMYIAYYNGGLRVVDVSGELRGDLYRQGREIAAFLPYDPDGFIPNAPFVMGPQPYKGHIFFTDWNSGLWAVKLEEPEDPALIIGEPQ